MKLINLKTIAGAAILLATGILVSVPVIASAPIECTRSIQNNSNCKNCGPGAAWWVSYGGSAQYPAHGQVFVVSTYKAGCPGGPGRCLIQPGGKLTISYRSFKTDKISGVWSITDTSRNSVAKTFGFENTGKDCPTFSSNGSTQWVEFNNPRHGSFIINATSWSQPAQPVKNK